MHGAALIHAGRKAMSHCQAPLAAHEVVLALHCSSANRAPCSGCWFATEVERCLLTSPSVRCPPLILQPWSRTPCRSERWWISLGCITSPHLLLKTCVCLGVGETVLWLSNMANERFNQPHQGKGMETSEEGCRPSPQALSLLLAAL